MRSCVGSHLTLQVHTKLENPCGFSEVGGNKQLLIAIVVCSFLFGYSFF